jgi:predicted metal-dependent hydrolase
MQSDIDLGKIVFVRSQRAKHINVRIMATGLKVTLPYTTTEQKALDFIKTEQKRIYEKQKKIKAKSKLSPTYLTENSELQTLTFKIVLKAVDRKDIYFLHSKGVLKIEYPTTANCQTEQIQKHFWNGINYFLRQEAKKLLPNKTSALASKYGFDYNSVKIQSSKTRWGSCTGVGNINLSLYLLLLPEHLIDYVILHELCHTKELNHSKKFWEWMDKVTDNKSEQYRREMKLYNMPG